MRKGRPPVLQPTPSQTLPEAPVGAAPVYTPEQLVEMHAIPSRAVLEDGTKNPFYNPKMDPGSDRWTAHAYFAAQPQVDVFVYPDPEAPELEVFPMSINGFTLPCYPNKRQKMPRDFVDLLKGRNHQFDVHERGLVSRRDDEEGSLSLTVSGSKVKPFIRRVAD